MAAVTDVWVQRYAGADAWSDHGEAVTFDADGNVIVTGSSYNTNWYNSFAISYDIYTVKYAATNGAILWTNRYNGPGKDSDDRPLDLAVDGNGNVVVVGYSQTNRNFDYYIAKYAGVSGALLWERRYDGTANVFDSIGGLAIDARNDVFVTGISDGNGGRECFTAKYAGTNGVLLWERRDVSSGRTMKLGPDGNFILAGTADGHYYAAKHSGTNGALLWETPNVGPSNASYVVVRSLAIDRNGNAIVTGRFSSSGGTTGYDQYTAKFAATNGALVWENTYSRSATASYGPVGIAVDADGNAFVTGGLSTDTNRVILTVKHSAATGTVLWERHHQSFEGAFAYSIRVNSLNHVVVSGGVSNGTNTDCYTVSYAIDDGAVRWERQYNGTGNGPDQPYTSRALALGPNGRVAVTGYSQGKYVGPQPGSGIDMITILYRERFAPVITCPSNIVLHCISNGLAVATFNVSAVDDDGVAVAVMCVPPSGTAFPLGETIVTCSAGNGDGLTNSCSFLVIVRDILPPALSCPPDVTLEFSNASGAGTNFAVVSTDVCDEAPLLMCVPATGDTFPIGQTMVHCMTVDGSANSNSCVFTVTVLGARGVKQKALNALIELRPTITRPANARRLERAIKNLSESLNASYWMDETKLIDRHAGRVFIREKFAARSLCLLLQHQTDAAAQSAVAENINRIFRADRLIAAIQIQQAVQDGATPSRIEVATRLLEKADQVARNDGCAPVIELYRRAWRKVR